MLELIQLLDDTINNSLVNCVVSNKRNKLGAIDKVKIRQVILKNKSIFQISEYSGTKVFHSNMNSDETKNYLSSKLSSEFKQCQIQTETISATILVSNKGQITIKKKGSSLKLDLNKLSHNRPKEYLIKEGTPVPFMIDLGVMTKEGLIIKSKYDKFRQINRFLEFIDDIIPKLNHSRKLTILDFGCGKSYLTFAIYYYLKVVKAFDISIIGLDLKTDVIDRCNLLAKKYGYSDLLFLKGDIADYEGVSKVDMVVTLHACDTATDYALAKAVKWDADVILSVPCCQHEINKQINNELLAPILEFGILKERMSALITDGVRANILREAGYDAQILEFIDMEHTPKNLLIRAVKTPNQKSSDFDTIKLTDMFNELHINPTLYNLLKEEK